MSVPRRGERLCTSGRRTCSRRSAARLPRRARARARSVFARCPTPPRRFTRPPCPNRCLRVCGAGYFTRCLSSTVPVLIGAHLFRRICLSTSGFLLIPAQYFACPSACVARHDVILAYSKCFMAATRDTRGQVKALLKRG